ncbi:Gamma-glutamylputrescine oxidoreductase [Mycobacteroides salmoniphilum]|uniref:Gamma-glutamylputrescine oxidoreductase n=1 Tax=Mycobacteroides salmoniphilum TaxID=404941 RepID=A0A4R8S270_9MYCO|nr:FAD-dependent oxidoreductase [Mycobacteroides salmoniphilum]TDZ80125.1 Gamma-glutamylputrescine oxidoreductase [Mycobacteroides salmoniphilum]
MQTLFERQPPPPGLVERALADATLTPFWLDDLSGSASYPPLSVAPRRHFDLVIIGAGYTGLWSALRALQRNPGITVAVIEAHTVGSAASGRNGGFIDASLTHGPENGHRRWPGEVEHLERLGLANLDDIENTVKALSLDCDFERNGSLTVAIEPYQAEELNTAASARPTGFLDQRAVRNEVNSPTYLAGTWSTESSALVHPAKLAAELSRAATDLGAEIFEHTRASAIGRRSSSGLEIHTEHGSVWGSRVILATNAFPSLLRRYRFHTVPVYDYVLVTEPLTTGQLGQVGWQHRQGISDMANQFHYYRLTPDNRILWGGYDAIYHFGGTLKARYEDRPDTYRRLASHFFTTFPQLEDVRFSHRWAGAIDTSTRFCAFFGSAHRGRVAYAAGFTGLGVAAARFAADVMLDRLSGIPTERTKLEMVSTMPVPFPPEPLAAVGIGATRWSLDRADHHEGKRNLLLKALDAVGMGFDS